MCTFNNNFLGNTSNFLFWPGGFDEPEKNENSKKSEIDFENNLRTTAKGFSSGIEFEADNCTPKSLNRPREEVLRRINEKQYIDLKRVIENEKHSWTPNNLPQSVSKTDSNLEDNKVELPNIDGVLEPFKTSNIPVFKISEASKNNAKTEWAEQIDIKVPVTDFNKKIPEPAMTFPYELDNFQKQAILKLEEQKDVFVAAHTSAGKTTIAEYAIAMSQKHMTRFLKATISCTLCIS